MPAVVLEPERYTVQWDESKHPRGQPDNAGQFSSGQGSGKSAPAAKTPPPMPAPNMQGKRGHELSDTDWDALHIHHRQSLKNEDWDAVESAVETMHGLLVDKLCASLSDYPFQQQAEQYRQTISNAIRQMSSKVWAEIGKNVKAVHFHPTEDDVTVARFAIINRDAKQIDPSDTYKLRQVALAGPHRTTGMWTYSTANREKGELHLDGGTDMEGTTLPYAQSDETIAVSIYRHELGHALDGRRVHSNNPEWMQAWTEEIRAGDLSNYAKTSTTEGFAEFARLVFSRPSEARQFYPKCWAYWKTQGFV